MPHHRMQGSGRGATCTGGEVVALGHFKKTYWPIAARLPKLAYLEAYRQTNGVSRMMTSHANGRAARSQFTCVSAATWLALASPSVAADASQGEQLARRWCASCHVVAGDQRQATQEAPPFATIARTPGFDANRLAFFLLNPHPKMPDMSLTRSEAGDLAAYIGSFAR